MTFDRAAEPVVTQTYRVVVHPNEGLLDALERENRAHQWRLDLVRATCRSTKAA